MGPLAVYLLETHRFSKKYSRFMRSNPKAFPEFYPDMYGKSWKPPLLGSAWKPPKLIGDVAPDHDYPGEGAPAWLVPIFSPRAAEGLREFLEPNGELLPVIAPLGTYYAYNVTRVIDALDIDASEITGFGRRQINRYAFKAESIDGHALFKIPQQRVEIYVTDAFVERVQELKLNGMWITKCWPMPPGVRWLDSWEADDERIIKWCCEVMVAAMKQAKSDGMFKYLGNPKACVLSAQDIDSGFFWPEGGKKIVRAG
jgi:hypothetical protein